MLILLVARTTKVQGRLAAQTQTKLEKKKCVKVSMKVESQQYRKKWTKELNRFSKWDTCGGELINLTCVQT